MVADAEAQKQMKEMFLKLAGDDLEVDAYELQSMLNSLFMKGTLYSCCFCAVDQSDSCRRLIARQNSISYRIV